MNPAAHPERNHHLVESLFPVGTFTLAEALEQLRGGRVAAVGAEVAAAMDRATDELIRTHSPAGMPAVGGAAPRFELADQNGTVIALDDLRAAGPVVVVFYRGAWCPFCSVTLRAYQQLLPELRALGADLVAISLQVPDGSLTTAERNHLTYHVLSDVGGAVSRAYGLIFRVPGHLETVYRELGLSLPELNGTDDWELPVPASFVIDRGGTVRFAEALPDYMRRSNPAEVLAVVREISAEGTEQMLQHKVFRTPGGEDGSGASS